MTLSRNYDRPPVDPSWAENRGTHAAVAMAIHAIADKTRSPEAIWESPTAAEWNRVTRAVEEYVAHGDFHREEDGKYRWRRNEFLTLGTGIGKP